MAQAIKTMGAILNDASEGMARDMEGARRSALTGVQLKGEVADQKWKEDERSRTRAYLEDAKALGKQTLVRRVPRQNQQAAIPTGQPGEVVAPVEYDEVPIDLSSPEGIKAVNAYQTGLFQLRAKHGLAAPEEAEKMVGFRRKLDQLGVTQDFEAALKGDADALVRVSKLAGLDGVAKIAVGFDEIGSPNLYAFTNRSDGKGGTTQSKVPIGHLAAAFSKEFYDQTVGTAANEVKAREQMKNDASTRTYQDRQGRAALENATSRNNKRMADSDQYRVFSDLEAKNSNKYLAPGFTTMGPSGAESVADDQASGLVHTFGAMLIEQDGFTGGKAHVEARRMLTNYNNRAKQLYEIELARAKASGDRRKVMDMEDNGVTYWQQYRQRMVDDLLARSNAPESGK